MKILVHIGHHKTGSTWLQKEFFETAKMGFYPLDDHKDDYPEYRCKKLAPVLYKPHDYDFDPQAFRNYVLENCDIDEDKVGVISDEDLCGVPHYGARDSASVATRLKDSLPEAQILIVLREQFSMIFSYYYQYLKSGGVHSFADFMGLSKERDPHAFSFEHYKYDRIINHYQKLFGPENVIVMPYEDLKNDNKAFMKELCERAEADFDENDMPKSTTHNTGDYQLATYLTRHLGQFLSCNKVNNYSPYAIHKDDRRAGKNTLLSLREKFDVILPKGIERRLIARQKDFLVNLIGQDYYAESNETTRQITGLPLKQYT